MPGPVARAILENGFAHVGGFVADARATPHEGAAATLARWGFEEGASPFGTDAVHVMTFPAHRLMQLTSPTNCPARPWPTYPSGFLAAPPIIPVWWLQRTRTPRGTVLWRVEPDGERIAVARYEGLARGWRGARGYLPPTDFVGMRAEWGGADLPAEFVDGETAVELVALAPTRPPGFEAARPMTWVRTVPLAGLARLFELTLTCRHDEYDWRIIGQRSDVAVLELRDNDPTVARTLGARQVDVGVFESEVRRSELVDVSGHTREIPAEELVLK